MRLATSHLPTRSKYKRFVFILIIPVFTLTAMLTLNTEETQSGVVIQPISAKGANPVLDTSQITGVIVSRQAPNLAPDPSFEEATKLPNALWRRGGDCPVALVSDTAHAGEKSARIIGGDGECKLHSKTETMRVEPDRYYDLSCWIKSDLLPNTGDAHILLRFLDEDKTTINTMTSKKIENTGNNWSEVTASKLAPPDAYYAQLKLKVSANSEGSVWFDDCYVGLSITLDVEKKGNPDEVKPGEPLTYTLIYSNSGREKGAGVQVVETYPDEVIYQSANPSPDLSINVWNIGPILTGTTGVITVSTQVEAGTCSTDLVNRVEMTSDDLEIILEDTLFTPITNTNCVTSGGVKIKPSDTPAKSGMPGDTVSYTYLVENIGDQAGTVSLDSYSLPGWGIITPTFPFSLPAQSSRLITFSVIIPQDVRQATSGLTDPAAITATLQHTGIIFTDTATATTTVLHKIGVVIEKDQTESPKNPITFTHTLTNTGNLTDSIELTATVDETDPLSLSIMIEPSSTLKLGPGDTISFTVPISGVSTGIINEPRTKAVITVTAQSQFAPIGVAETIDKIETNCRLDVDPPNPAAKNGRPGDEVSYTFPVTNTGIQTGEVTIGTESSENWEGIAIAPPAPFQLPPGESQPITVTVMIPQAISVTVDSTMITTTFECGNENGSHTDVVSTTVEQVVGVDIEPGQTKPPKDPITFTHILTNTGNATGIISLTTLTAPKALSIAIQPALTVALTALQTQTITMVVTGISANIINEARTKAVITVTAQSQFGAADDAQAIDKAESSCRLDVDPPNPAAKNGGPGDAVSYTFPVTNTGIQTGTVTIDTQSSEIWEEILTSPASFLLPPDESQLITVSVRIPAAVTKAISGTEDQTVITTTFECGNAESSHEAIITTAVNHISGVDIAPDQTKPPKNPITFSHTLTNTGNWTDTFDLEPSSNPLSLSIMIEPASSLRLGPGEAITITVPISGVSTDIANEPQVKAVITITARSHFTSAVIARVVNQVKTVVLYLPIIHKCHPLPIVSEHEPNNNIGEAIILTSCPQHTLTGQVKNPGDRDDVYKIFARVGQTLTIALTGIGSGNADLFLYPPGTNDVTDPRADESKDSTNNEVIRYPINKEGYWYISVFATKNPKGTVAYTMTVSLMDP